MREAFCAASGLVKTDCHVLQVLDDRSAVPFCMTQLRERRLADVTTKDAVKWCRKAADQGHAAAKEYLAARNLNEWDFFRISKKKYAVSKSC